MPFTHYFSSNIPKGYKKLSNNEIIPPDCLCFGVNWGKGCYWETMTHREYFIGLTPNKFNKAPFHRGAEMIFAKPAPRFKTNKPYPYGY